MKARSLEAGLRWRLVAVLTLLWLAGTLGAGVALWHETGEVLDSALEETAQRLLVLPLQDDDAATPRVAEVGEHEEHVIYQVFDARGRLRLRSHEAPEEPLGQDLADGLHRLGPWRVAVITRDDGRRRAVVAEALEHRVESVTESLLALVWPLAVLLPAAVVLVGVVIRRGLTGVRQTGEALDRRAAHELDPLPLAPVPVEMQPFVRSVNALLARVGQLLQAEQAFAAQAAHELRTPLAAARAQAQRLLAHTGDEGLQERVRSLLRQIDRLTRTSERLLDLARLRGGAALRRSAVDLAELARLVVSDFGGEGAAVSVRVVAPPPVLQADADLLALALRNLVENALRHGRAPVVVEVAPGRLTVLDAGAGVSPEEWERLARPFERGATPAGGTGLGLALVAQVARAHGAELGAAQAPGGGFAVTLEWPRPR